MSESDQDNIIPEHYLSGEFFNKLAMISDHPFVTSESARKKDRLIKLDTDLHNQFPDIDGIATVAVGSVGVGVANNTSDTDAFLFLIPNSAKDYERVYKYVAEDHNLRDVNIVNFTSALNDTWAIDYIETNNGSSMFLSGLNRLAFVFAPTLTETRNPDDPINQMRRMLLQKIVSVYPDKAETIWNAISENINRYLVDYEHLQFGSSESAAQRPIKVARAIDTVLDNRIEDPIKKQRVKQIIERRRANFKYPDLQSMLDTFGVSR